MPKVIKMEIAIVSCSSPGCPEITKISRSHRSNGDLNEKVGIGIVRGVTGMYGLGNRNERGIMLAQFCHMKIWSSRSTSTNYIPEGCTLGNSHKMDGDSCAKLD